MGKGDGKIRLKIAKIGQSFVKWCASTIIFVAIFSYK